MLEAIITAVIAVTAIGLLCAGVLVVAAIALIAGIGLGIANRFMAVKENAKKVRFLQWQRSFFS